MTRLAMWPKSLLSLTCRRNVRRTAKLLKTFFKHFVIHVGFQAM